MNRQKYVDAKIEEALASPHHNLWQIKYDGIWCRIEVKDGWATAYSRTDKIKTEFELHAPTCILIGEYMFGSQRAQTHPMKDNFMLFDCPSFGDQDIRDKPYIYRWQIISVLLNNLTPQFQLVRNFSMNSAPAAWDKLQATEEGMVFRNSHDTYDTTLTRVKYEIEKVVYAVDFHAGMGKHSHHLGAISVALTPMGAPVMRVGGGFSDEQRSDIWRNIDYYRRRPLEVYGKGEFESGALRHPNFKRWL